MIKCIVVLTKIIVLTVISLFLTSCNFKETKVNVFADYNLQIHMRQAEVQFHITTIQRL